jgi:glucose/mannose transport system substrate-binding protein
MLLRPLKMGLAAALLCGTAPAWATELVIFHTWSSPAEVASLNILKAEFEAKGHTWTDLAIPHDSGANVSLINLITGGNPPNIFLEANPGIYRDLVEMGMGHPMTEFFAENGITEHLPDAVLKSITVDGEIMKVPTAIHIDGMVYYNMDVAEAAGVDPAAWTSLDDMFEDFPAIREAGYEPLAIGGQKWQIGYLTHALVAALHGPEIYDRIYGAEPDRDAIDTPEMRAVLQMLRRFQQETDAGSSNRDWNVTTNTVITGQALMQIHGDWMKGEWRAAGKVAGEDFGCVNIPGTRGLSVTVDAWGLLGGVDEETDQAELDFAAVVVDPEIQAAFAAQKGSTPVRLDAPESGLDACSGVVLEALANPEIQFQNPHNTADADWMNSIWDVVFEYWSDPEMTEDDAIAGMQDAYDTIF